MTGMTPSEQTRTLCIVAQKDEQALQFPLPDHAFGFFAQQSCEKLLKALISAHGVAFRFTHLLEELEDQVTGLGEQLPEMPYDILLLVPYAVRFRYEDSKVIREEDRLLIRESVRVLREFCLQRVLELEGQASS